MKICGRSTLPSSRCGETLKSKWATHSKWRAASASARIALARQTACSAPDALLT